MSKEESLVPHRRFKEFENSGAWEQHKLGDISEIYDGVHQTPDYKKSGVMFLSVENISNLKSNKFISQEDFENNFKVSPKHGDILMTRIGNVGTPNVVESTDSLAFYVSLALIKPKLINPYFLCNSIESPITQANIQKRTLTTAIPQKINKDEIKNVEIKLPRCQGEQAKIGNLFQKIDYLITLHQRKLNKLKKLKSAYLTEMFPAEGERKPKRRFAGFTDDWEQHKLGEVAVVNSGRDYKHLSKGNIPVYGTGGYMLSVDKSLSEKDDGIGIGRKGTINKPYILRAPFWTVDTLFYVIPTTTKLNFLYGVFQKIDWLKKDESTGVPSLSKENINKTRVWIPKISEQKKIGSFLKQFDHLITLHQRKINKLKKLKAAYLNEMFV